jgi:hypothetical protein
MITYTNNVNSLIAIPDQDSFTNVVKFISCTVTGTDGISSASMDCYITLSDVDADNFIEYQNITEETVNTWIATCGAGAISDTQNVISNMLCIPEAKPDPDFISMTPPWVS